MGKVMRALGLMSGTSLDGIDAALIESDGENRLVRGPSATFPYAPDMQRLLRAALADARAMTQRAARTPAMREAEEALTRRHAEAVQAFLERHAVSPAEIDVIGFHGQTVLHRPERRLTVQLGDGQGLAQMTGLQVVYDMRAADVEAGGQGAPLVPVYHRALVAKLRQRPVAIVNIGGVANVTFVDSSGRLIAFDTGPGNALMDDWVRGKTGATYDENGTAAGRGSIDATRLHAYLSNPYFTRPPPKSLDRNAFALPQADTLSFEDGAATLASFTASAIARCREHLPGEPALWIICGGGRRNRAVMAMLAQAVENAVVPAETVGLDGDSLEAEAWAYLAVRSLAGLPLTFPETTGVHAPLTGGLVARP